MLWSATYFAIFHCSSNFKALSHSSCLGLLLLFLICTGYVFFTQVKEIMSKDRLIIPCSYLCFVIINHFDHILVMYK